jgi:hypothetical protein
MKTLTAGPLWFECHVRHSPWSAESESDRKADTQKWESTGNFGVEPRIIGEDKKNT